VIAQMLPIASLASTRNGPRPDELAVFARRQRNDDVLAHARFIEIANRAALHEPVGQMIGKVAHPGQPQRSSGRARPARRLQAVSTEP
jgi:hypothetical protein